MSENSVFGNQTLDDLYIYNANLQNAIVDYNSETATYQYIRSSLIGWGLQTNIGEDLMTQMDTIAIEQQKMYDNLNNLTENITAYLNKQRELNEGHEQTGEWMFTDVNYRSEIEYLSRFPEQEHSGPVHLAELIRQAGVIDTRLMTFETAIGSIILELSHIKTIVEDITNSLGQLVQGLINTIHTIMNQTYGLFTQIKTKMTEYATAQGANIDAITQGAEATGEKLKQTMARFNGFPN